MLRAFVRLSRLKFLTGGFLGFGLGAAAAVWSGAPLTPGAYVLGQSLVTAFHLMTHYSNDFFDRESDAQTTRTDFSGGSGALVDGSLPPQVGLVAALVCAALGLLATATAAASGRTTLALLGVAIAFGAWFYSAPPLRLLARGLGELDTALVVAVLVPLAGFATLAGHLGPVALVLTVPGACAMLAMMFAIEVPDLVADTASGKRNLLVRYGTQQGTRFLIAAVASTYLAALAAPFAGAPWTLPPFVLLTAPVAFALVRACARREYGSYESDRLLAARGVAFFVATTLAALVSIVAVL